MVPPGARKQDGALKKYSGCCGVDQPFLAAAAWKLFQIPIILVGWHGLSSSTSARSTVVPVGAHPAYMSPS